MFNACIFDLDGTLVNSLTDLAASTNHALSVQGFPVYETERYRYFVGRGVAKLIEDVLPEKARTPDVLKKTRALFDEHYNSHYLDNTLPYDGVPQLLADLAGRGIRLGVVSNKPDDFVKKIVTALFGDRFDTVLGQREGVPRKPDPTGAREACRLLGSSPESCLYVGDSGVDMLTAAAAGMYAVGVLWGFRQRDELSENGARALIAAPAELTALLGRPLGKA